MKDITNAGVPFEFKGKTYNLKMTMYALRMIQSKFDVSIFELEKMIDLKSSKLLENIGYIMTLFINESIIIENEENGLNEPLLTQEYIERNLSPFMFNECLGIIVNAIMSSFPQSEESEGNAQSPNL